MEDKNWGQENLPAEIVWGPGKSASQLVIALQRVVQTGCAAIAVRVSPKVSSPFTCMDVVILCRLSELCSFRGLSNMSVMMTQSLLKGDVQ